ncbi:hypothetical protein D3C87_1393280 [compost metagenome]
MRFFIFVLLIMSSFNPAWAAEKLEIVPTDKVCMVTNMVFPRPQIPVVHAGKTYYGCCENCKKTLSEDASARAAIDPISGKSIDKAKAVIAAREDGSVLYFGSKSTYEQYRKKSK